MKRPDLATLACVNPDCQLFGRTDEGNLTVRKVYGYDQLRLLRCRTCGEEFSERRGSALFNMKLPEGVLPVAQTLLANCEVLRLP
jgi:hypothetical protein